MNAMHCFLFPSIELDLGNSSERTAFCLFFPRMRMEFTDVTKLAYFPEQFSRCLLKRSPSCPTGLWLFALDHCEIVIVILTCHRHATPYHAPVYLAQAKGFFADEGLKVALLEPNDPSVRSCLPSLSLTNLPPPRPLTLLRMLPKSSAAAK